MSVASEALAPRWPLLVRGLRVYIWSSGATTLRDGVDSPRRASGCRARRIDARLALPPYRVGPRDPAVWGSQAGLDRHWILPARLTGVRAAAGGPRPVSSGSTTKHYWDRASIHQICLDAPPARAPQRRGGSLCRTHDRGSAVGLPQSRCLPRLLGAQQLLQLPSHPVEHGLQDQASLGHGRQLGGFVVDRIRADPLREGHHGEGGLEFASVPGAAI